VAHLEGAERTWTIVRVYTERLRRRLQPATNPGVQPQQDDATTAIGFGAYVGVVGELACTCSRTCSGTAAAIGFL
jgi:hypothetical protein